MLPIGFWPCVLLQSWNILLASLCVMTTSIVARQYHALQTSIASQGDYLQANQDSFMYCIVHSSNCYCIRIADPWVLMTLLVGMPNLSIKRLLKPKKYHIYPIQEGKTVIQVQMGSIVLVAGWEAQSWALQSAGVDLFSQAKEASTVLACLWCCYSCFSTHLHSLVMAHSCTEWPCIGYMVIAPHAVAFCCHVILHLCSASRSLCKTWLDQWLTYRCCTTQTSSEGFRICWTV